MQSRRMVEYLRRRDDLVSAGLLDQRTKFAPDGLRRADRGVVQLVLCVLFLHCAPQSAHRLHRRWQFRTGAANDSEEHLLE